MCSCQPPVPNGLTPKKTGKIAINTMLGDRRIFQNWDCCTSLFLVSWGRTWCCDVFLQIPFYRWDMIFWNSHNILRAYILSDRCVVISLIKYSDNILEYSYVAFVSFHDLLLLFCQSYLTHTAKTSSCNIIIVWQYVCQPLFIRRSKGNSLSVEYYRLLIIMLWYNMKTENMIKNGREQTDYYVFSFATAR